MAYSGVSADSGDYMADTSTGLTDRHSVFGSQHQNLDIADVVALSPD